MSPPTERQRHLIGLSPPKVDTTPYFLVLSILFVEVLLIKMSVLGCCLCAAEKIGDTGVRCKGLRGALTTDGVDLYYPFHPLLCRFPLSHSPLPRWFSTCGGVLFTGISLRPGQENPSHHAPWHTCTSFLYGFTHRVGDGTLERVLPCGFKDSNGLSLVSARAGRVKGCPVGASM